MPPLRRCRSSRESCLAYGARQIVRESDGRLLGRCRERLQRELNSPEKQQLRARFIEQCRQRLPVVGYADFYYQVRHIYWAVDEFKYWTMGSPVEKTDLINRARVDAPEPWKK